MKILFLHPDLGIGGAERLVVDAAIAMQQSSHQVHFVTAHHDTNHCFQETSDGTLPVTVIGDSLPRSIFGICNALCAYFRMIVAALYIVFFSKLEFDVIFCDQISAPIPILKLSKKKIIFYCHFPDQVLTKRESLLKKVYRAPIDWIEQWTTGMADVILVNSKFTGNVFRQTFPKLAKLPIKVIYPSINFSSFDLPVEGDLDLIKLKDITTVFLSINRYERKKNLSLAIYALAELYKELELKSPLDKKNVYLIMGGGYDELVEENKEYYKELEQLAADLHVDDKVSLRKSLSDSQKHSFLHSCTAVIYTPENEHFGIVPLEAMYMYRPVIAANSGGPLETIVDDETGFLCEPNPTEFCSAMMKFVEDKSLAREMGISGRRRVEKYFSFETNSQNLIGKVAIVTGSSSGIGAATAIRLATYGAQVVINGRNQEKLEKVYQQCKIASQKGNFKITNPVIQVIGDVTDDEICQNLVKTTIEKFGKIDILVNNAGNSFPTSIYDPNLLEEYDNLMNLNVRSVIVLTQLVVPHLEKTKGVIVNVSSIASIKPLMPIYSMSKAALDMFTKSLALELGPKGIRVNGVNPGPINTQLFDSLFKGLPIEMKSKIIEEMGKTMTLERLGQPEEIAKHITFLASDDSSFITGTCLIDDGGAMWMMKT